MPSGFCPYEDLGESCPSIPAKDSEILSNYRLFPTNGAEIFLGGESDPSEGDEILFNCESDDNEDTEILSIALQYPLTFTLSGLQLQLELPSLKLTSGTPLTQTQIDQVVGFLSTLLSNLMSVL